MANPKMDRDEAAVTLFRHLFHDRFCLAEEITQAKKGQVLLSYFLGWLQSQSGLFDVGDILEKSGVDASVWDFIWTVIGSGSAVESLMPVWYAICLSDRPDPSHDLAAVHAVLLITWKDGRVMPLSSHVSQDLLAPSLKLNDGLVANIIRRTVLSLFVGNVVEHGLDTLHDQSRDYRGTTAVDPYEYLAGLVAKNLAGDSIPEAYRKPVADVWRLLQALFRPPIDPAIRAQIEAQRRRAAGPGGSAVTGGWDEG